MTTQALIAKLENMKMKQIKQRIAYLHELMHSAIDLQLMLDAREEFILALDIFNKKQLKFAA